MSLKVDGAGITLFWIVSGLLLSGGLTISSYEYSYHHEGYMRDHDPDRWAPEPITQRKCVPIPTGLSLCSNVGYDMMTLPNLLGHDSIEEVKRQAGPWVPLHNIRCHPNTDLFLCSLYAPVCLDNMDKAIQPCRSFCESVKMSCEGNMNKYGFQWPDILRCDKFPPGDLCIKQLNNTNMTAANVCEPCKKPLTYESLLDSYCWSDKVIKVKIKKVINEANGDKRLVIKGKMKFYKPKPKQLTQQEIASTELVIRKGASCDCEYAEKPGKYSLVMTSVTDGVHDITYISNWEKNKQFKRAIRAMRKGHDCKLQIDELPGGSDDTGGLGIKGPIPSVPPGGKDENKTDKKGKDRKKNKKDEDPMENIAGIGCIPCKQPLVFQNLIEKYCDAQFVMKAKVRKVRMDSNGDKRLIIKKLKTKDFYKQENLSKRDIKKLQPVIGGGKDCDCVKAAKGNKLFIMGRKEGSRYVTHFLDEDANDSEFKRFLRAIRKGYECPKA